MWHTIATAMIAMSRSIGKMFGYELAVIISEHSIKLQMVNPDNKVDRAYDDNTFVSGNIFVKDFANPLSIKKISEAYEEQDFITSERYKKFMEQSLIDDIVRSSKDDGLTVTQAVIILGAIQVLSVAIIYIVG